MECFYSSDATLSNERPPRMRAVELIAEDDYRRELKKLSDVAFAFLGASDGDPIEAEQLLDNFIDLIFEGGALSTWRYRILLAQVRDGL
jgi:hypothetical protein